MELAKGKGKREEGKEILSPFTFHLSPRHKINKIKQRTINK
jgi:predicted small metal-binding protein